MLPSGGPGRKDHHIILQDTSKVSFVPLPFRSIAERQSSPLCEAKGKASRAEGFRRTVKAFRRMSGLWKAEVCYHL